MRKIKIGELLQRIKEPIILKDEIEYKRITIRSKNQGISLRNIEFGRNIGTKKQFLVRRGQFLLSKIDAKNGAFGIVSAELDNAVITGNFWAFEVNDKLLKIEWFNIFVSSTNFMNICSKASSGTTNRQYLDEKKFLNFEIDLPDLKEQERFIQRYDSLYNKVSELKYELDFQSKKVERLKSKIITEIIQGKFVRHESNNEPASAILEKMKIEKAQLLKEKKIRKTKPIVKITDEEKPFCLPNGWEWVRLGELVSSIKDGPHYSPEYVEKGIPFISAGNISEKNVDFKNTRFISKELHEELSKRCLPQIGDILYTKGGTTGIAKVNTYNIEFNVWVHVAVIKLLKNIDPFYLEHVLNSPFCYAQSQKFTHGTGNRDLGLTRMVNIILPLPPYNEQKFIVKKLDELKETLEELETRLHLSKLETEKLMKAVLQEAFAVKKEVIN